MIAPSPKIKFSFGVVGGLFLLAQFGHAQIFYSITDIGRLGTGTLSQATAINNAGQVVGVSYTNGTNGPRAVLYSNGTLTRCAASIPFL